MATAPGAIETHDMLLIHRVIRREIGLLPSLIRGAAGNRLRAKRVAAHAVEMLDFVHIHHSGEDELLWPVLRPRVTLEDDLIDRMEAQHAQLATMVEAVRRDLPGWATSADAVIGETMAARLETAGELLTEHLAEEEAQILPLVAASFSQAEWDALGEHGMSSVPGKRRLVILGYILEDTDETERRVFLQRVPPPARAAYRTIGKRQFAREIAAIRS